MDQTPPRPTLPLADVSVLEFTHAVMGPACGVILADLGADVLRIEPVDGDPTRRLRGFGTGYFPYFNRNKGSLALDLKTPEGKEIVLRLAKTADVVVENFGPGTMERLGYGWDVLSALNPRLVYCALKGFLSGPYEKRHAMDEVVQMMGGLAYMTGPPGQPLARRNVRRRHHGRHVRRHRDPARAPRARRDGKGLEGEERALRDDGFSHGSAHGLRGAHRGARAPDGGARLGVVRVPHLHGEGRPARLRGPHLRQALGAFLRGLRPRRTSSPTPASARTTTASRSARGCCPRSRGSSAPSRATRSSPAARRRTCRSLRSRGRRTCSRTRS